MNKTTAFILASLFPSIAFADTGATAPASAASLVLLACAIIPWALRRFTSSSHFLHTSGGMALVSALSLAATAVASAVSAQGLNGSAILQSLIAAAMSAMAMSKPEGASDKNNVTQLRSVALCLTPALFFLASCGFCQQVSNKSTARCQAESVTMNCGLPEVEKIALELAPKVLSALLSENASSLLDGIVHQLELDGQTDPIGLVTCAIYKVTGNPAASSNPSTTEVAVYVRGQQWIAAHPAKVKLKSASLNKPVEESPKRGPEPLEVRL